MIQMRTYYILNLMMSNVKIGEAVHTTRVLFRFVCFRARREERICFPLLCFYYGNVKNIMYNFQMIQNNTYKSLVTGTSMSM